MAPTGDNTFTFTVNEKGSVTGEQFNWGFTAKRRLSIRDMINKDAQRRFLIGDRPETASDLTLMRAEILAHLSVSITESPQAWKDSAGGLDFYDDNILMKMYKEINDVQLKVAKESEQVAEESKEKLRKASRKKEEQKDEGSAGGA